MTRRGGWLLGGALLLAVVAACRFEPDLSRFPACGEDGACPEGSTCLAEAQRCLPDCGERGPCVPEVPDAGTDAGEGDAGFEDAGTDGGFEDAGTDAGTPLSLDTSALDVATESVAYTATFTASGGTPPYSFRAVEGLPPSLSLGTEGTLSGQPTKPDSVQLTVEVADSSQPPAHAQKTYTLRIRPLLRFAGPRLLADAPVNTSYTEQVSATGGTPPYHFALDSGALPSGLKLQDEGSVTGTATQTTSSAVSFKVRVTDSDTPAQSVVGDASLTVFSPGLLSGATITTQSLPDARLGQPYRYVLQSAKASSPTWTLTSASPPDGIILDADTGVLSGAPTAGSRSFTVQLSGGGLSGSTTKGFSVTVY